MGRMRRLSWRACKTISASSGWRPASASRPWPTGLTSAVRPTPHWKRVRPTPQRNWPSGWPGCWEGGRIDILPAAGLARTGRGGTGRWRPAAGAKSRSPPRRARLYRVGPRLFARTLTGPGNARQSVIPAEGTVIDAAAAGNSVLVQPFDDDDFDTPSLGMLGCDPAVGLLETELRRRGVRLVAAEESSREALLGLARGEAHVAGCHLRDDVTGSFNRTWVERLVPFPCTLVTFASWEQGLMVAPGNPKGIRGIESLANPGVAMVNRQSGSGSRALLDRALLSYGVPAEAIAGYQREEYGHLAVAAAVAYGGADVGVGVKAAALATGLDFIPLEAERYDLVVPDHLLNDPAVQALLTSCGGTRSIAGSKASVATTLPKWACPPPLELRRRQPAP